jgi:hypothetical protein
VGLFWPPEFCAPLFNLEIRAPASALRANREFSAAALEMTHSRNATSRRADVAPRRTVARFG